MKRLIKFRGKRLDNSQWVYGHYAEGTPGYHYITNPNEPLYPIDPETLGQFTGILDKNNTEIYEDDFIQCGNHISLPVSFGNGCFYTKSNGVQYRLGGWDKFLIVRGNTHYK